MLKSRLPYLATLGTFLSMAACTTSPAAPDSPRNVSTRTAATVAPGAVATSATPATPSPAPSPSPSASASPTATPAASPSPSAWASLGPNQAALSGTVYDEQGRPVAGAQVVVVALDNSFNATATTDASGYFALSNPPASVQLTITATKPGDTSRMRVESLSAGVHSVYDFGGPASAADPTGPAYFISSYPEVTSVSPADMTAGNSGTPNSYTLTLSKPLDATNRDLFARAIRIWPANAQAAPAANPAPSLLNASSTAQQLAALPLTGSYANGNYAISKDSTFDASTTASVSWDSSDTIATLTFKAPLIGNSTVAPRYQIGLVHLASSAAIRDASGHALGTDPAGTPGTAPDISDGNNDLIDNAFEAPLLTGSTWASTHEYVTYFDLTQDNTTTPPTLTAVSGTVVGSQSRLLLTFSEPMMAGYDGNPATNGEYLSSTAANPANYVFAFGKISADVSGVTLNAGTPQTANSFAQVATGTPVVFSPGAVTIDADPANPSIIRLTAAGTSDEFPADLGAVKVRVVNVQDPVGNAIADTNDATSNVQMGTL